METTRTSKKTGINVTKLSIAALLLTICIVSFASNSLGDVIIDNGQPGTSSTGTWAVSGAPNPYGTNSVWGYSGATYTWSFTPATTGTYSVSMWWTALTSRSTSVPVTIQNAGTAASVRINQTQNGGQWNVLGQYSFNAGTTYKVTITAPTGSPPSTSADAVKWAPISTNSAPTASITSITPNPATYGQNVSFVGAGNDSDGNVTAYNWQSITDGNLSTQSSFTKNNLSVGTHTISFKVQDNGGAWSPTVNSSLVIQSVPTDIIIDNGSTNCIYTGTWSISGGTGAYGADSYWSRNGATYTWRVTPKVNANYEVFAWWTAYPSRAANVPIDIVNAGGTNRVTINQQANGGKWNSLGVFPFQAGITYNITVTAANGETVSTCADAIKLSYNGPINIPLPPTAQILSINPNPGMPNQSIIMTGKATDSDGTIQAYSWRSSINGTFGTTRVVNTTQLSAGTHTIYFKAQDNSGLWSPEVSATLDVGRENIYIAQCYGGNEVGQLSFTSVLNSLGATQTGTYEWTYVNPTAGKTFYIHFVRTQEALLAAMARDGAHVIIEAHSNYGLGPVFSTSAEDALLMITNIRYVDDDRFIHLGTPSGVGVSISGMRTGQAYPYWWSNYKDGKNAIMPYDFGDANGPPPYNYYITYQVPGDSNYYKVETVNKSAYQRFSGCGKPPWYSNTGVAPDPNNPNQKQYFITNAVEWSPSIQSSGTWTQYQDAPANRVNSQYFKENYITNAAGTGSDYVRFLFTIPTAGQYKVFAWWPALSTNATDAPFTIFYNGGSKLVKVNQTVNGRRWNDLGTYNFNAGNYSVLLTDAASGGNVVADGIQIGHINNPPDVVQANFIADKMSGPAPLDVEFDNISTGDLTDRTWNCGDGFTNTTRDSLEHKYVRPGIYTVSLTVSGPLGSSSVTKTGYITVWPEGTQQNLPFKVEFDASSTNGQIPRTVRFEDMSTGLGDVNECIWEWSFGDGQTSTDQNPSHTYVASGNYTVSLTVTNDKGARATETKASFVRAVVFEKSIDNVDYPKKHWSSKTIVKPKGLDISKDQIKYGRILYGSCNSGDYYIQTVAHGLMFYTTATCGGTASLTYLQMYLQGKSDQEMWETMQQIESCYDYYNFNLPPGAAQVQQTGISTLAASTVEPLKLTSKQQADIAKLRKLSVADAFDRIAESRYVIDSRLSQKAISLVFAGSEEQAVDYALNIVQSLVQATDRSSINKLTIAKAILAQFVDVSAAKLLELYPQTNDSINANIITAAGPLACDPAIRNMLIKALDDKAMTINDNPELVGQPLRICDIAYNQLVLNLKISGVLRVIGTGMAEDTRDYHIDVLKKKL